MEKLFTAIHRRRSRAKEGEKPLFFTKLLRGNGISPRENLIAPRDNRKIPRARRKFPRENPVAPRENQNRPRENPVLPRENLTERRGDGIFLEEKGAEEASTEAVTIASVTSMQAKRNITKPWRNPMREKLSQRKRGANQPFVLCLSNGQRVRVSDPMTMAITPQSVFVMRNSGAMESVPLREVVAVQEVRK